MALSLVAEVAMAIDSSNKHEEVALDAGLRWNSKRRRSALQDTTEQLERWTLHPSQRHAGDVSAVEFAMTRALSLAHSVSRMPVHTRRSDISLAHAASSGKGVCRFTDINGGNVVDDIRSPLGGNRLVESAINKDSSKALQHTCLYLTAPVSSSRQPGNDINMADINSEEEASQRALTGRVLRQRQCHPTTDALQMAPGWIVSSPPVSLGPGTWRAGPHTMEKRVFSPEADGKCIRQRSNMSPSKEWTLERQMSRCSWSTHVSPHRNAGATEQQDTNKHRQIQSYHLQPQASACQFLTMQAQAKASEEHSPTTSTSSQTPSGSVFQGRVVEGNQMVSVTKASSAIFSGHPVVENSFSIPTVLML